MGDGGVVFLSLMPIQSHACPEGRFRGSDPHNVHAFELWEECGGPRSLGTTCRWMHMQWSFVVCYTHQVHSLTSDRSVLPCAQQK